MYQLLKTTSFQPKSVVKPSVNVPIPYAAIPNDHQNRCGAGFRSRHRRKTMGAKKIVRTVVAIGM